jgi:very-short-patch-repair endonuclease
VGAGGGGRSNAPAPEPRPTKLGHGWQSTETPRQKDRTRTNLRAKTLRKELTSSEKKLRDLLRTIEGAHFRKEVALGDCVFDFGWYSARLLIEIDGLSHTLNDVRANDEAKTAHATANGFRVLRFQNNDVSDRPAWVVAQVREALSTSASDRPPPLTPPHGGAGDEPR